jgi:hypothetical protein
MHRVTVMANICVLDAEQTRRLGEFARQQKVTLNTLIQAAWLLLLQRLTGQVCGVRRHRGGASG